jgi:endonuclease G
MNRFFPFLLLLILSLQHTFAFGQIEAIPAKEKELAELEVRRNALLKELEDLKLLRNRNELAKWGTPVYADSGTTYIKSAFAFNYNERAEQANWLAHIISPEIKDGIITRTNNFRVDPAVKTGTAIEKDYWNSGYDRGHLAPSADFRWSLNALSESYFYSNMTPQKPELNRERWAQLEDMLRRYVEEYGHALYVVTGPILESGLDSIGPNRVAVPKRFYKVVFDFSLTRPRGIAFIMPNGYCKYPVMYYAVTVDSVEKITRMNFWPKLDTDRENWVERTFTDSLWLVKKAKGNEAPLSKEDMPAGAVNSVEAKELDGKKATVCGRIVATKYSEKSGATFLNFDQKFPDQLFYISIWKVDLPNFPYQPHLTLDGKLICVTGTVTLNRNIPTINIKNEKSLQFLEDGE